MVYGMTKFVKLKIKKNIATITLNRPEKKNALTFEMLEKLTQIGNSLKKNDGLKCVIIQGTERVFSAGIDISNFATLAHDKKFLNKIMKPVEGSESNKMQMACTIWQDLEIPVIAVLEGPTFGAGLQLALGADIRIASKDTLISIMETNWGLIPDMGITTFLPALIGYDQAMRLTMTSEIIDASTARELGLITICANNLAQETTNLIQNITSKSPDAIKCVKKLYKSVWPKASSKSLHYEAMLQTKLIGTENQMEAVMANFEKRRPKFVMQKNVNEN